MYDDGGWNDKGRRSDLGFYIVCVFILLSISMIAFAYAAGAATPVRPLRAPLTAVIYPMEVDEVLVNAALCRPTQAIPMPCPRRIRAKLHRKVR